MFEMRLRSSLIILLLFGTCSAFAQDSTADAERLYAEAEKLRTTENAVARREAIKKYEAALEIFSDHGPRTREAQSLNSIGFIYGRLGEFEKSIEYLELSLQVSREIDDKKLQIIALLNIGRSTLLLGRNADSLSKRQLALSISREINDREMEASALNDIGITLFSDGEMHAAKEHFLLAASIFETLGKRLPKASLLNNIGRIDRLIGDQEVALGNYSAALAIFREEKHRSGEADVTLNLGSTYADLFRTAEAFEYFDKALKMFQDMGDRQREAVTLNNIGASYTKFGEQRTALDYYLRSASIAESLGDKRQQALALGNIGNIFLDLGELEKAKDYIDHSLEISRALKSRLEYASALTISGALHNQKGDYATAKIVLTESLAAYRELKSADGQARAHLQLGLANEHAGDLRDAIGHYDLALGHFRKTGMRGEMIKVVANLARTRRSLGEFAAARKDIEEAVEGFEYLRSTVPVQELRSSYFSVGRAFYELYIDLLLNPGTGKPSIADIEKAFLTNEQMRARSLIETLSASNLEIRRGIDPSILEQEALLKVRLNNKEAYRLRLLAGRSKPGQIESVEREIRDILGQYHQIRSRIQVSHPNYSALVQPPSASLRQIQNDVLDADSVLVEFSVGRDRSYVWVVTQDSIEHFVLPKRSEIEKTVRHFYRAMTARTEIVANDSIKKRRVRLMTADRELEQTTAELSSELLRPIAHRFTGKRLLIVADDILQYIPFGALSGQAASVEQESSGVNSLRRYLIETNEIVMLPSASTLSVLRSKKPTKAGGTRNRVSVIADPVFAADDDRLKTLRKPGSETIIPVKSSIGANAIPAGLRSDFARLRFSRAEALSIAGLGPKDRELIALDFEANLQTATSERVGRSEIIHFATHAIVNSSYPELSGIVLSLMDKNGARTDGYLRLHDIYNLQLDTDLVVLSACETALGKEIKGEGIVGLTRGFMYAGAPSVVASFWRVEDKATADLMKRFYQRMFNEKLPPSAALRASQIAMLKEKTTAHPLYWAGFALQGEWRPAR